MEQILAIGSIMLALSFFIPLGLLLVVFGGNTIFLCLEIIGILPSEKTQREQLARAC
jgi:hypothetical protein